METHYNTLWELFDAVAEHYNIEIPLITGGVGYGEYRKFHFDRKRGKKQVHVVIYRLESGRYELNSYVL